MPVHLDQPSSHHNKCNHLRTSNDPCLERLPFPSVCQVPVFCYLVLNCKLEICLDKTNSLQIQWISLGHKIPGPFFQVQVSKTYFEKSFSMTGLYFQDFFAGTQCIERGASVMPMSPVHSGNVCKKCGMFSYRAFGEGEREGTHL